MSPPATTSLDTEAFLRPEHRAWLMEKMRWPVLATIRKDGMPSQSVVWFDLDPTEDVVLINTLAGRLKHRHLQRDPRVSLCWEDETHYLTIEGRVTEMSPDPGMAGIWAMARRYGEGEGSFAVGERINIRIRIERVIWHP
jgi:PPOX class probable F420-dependent enzyme